ncbi:MAG TPA: hypothetical protein H9800_01685, partial [Candidatus Microbacterium stercoravium]|nr:hypothetical protein [Candidatus Microbacterium stercoravium]
MKKSGVLLGIGVAASALAIVFGAFGIAAALSPDEEPTLVREEPLIAPSNTPTPTADPTDPADPSADPSSPPDQGSEANPGVGDEPKPVAPPPPVDLDDDDDDDDDD